MEKASRKPAMTDLQVEAGSSLWTSSSDEWERLDLDQADMRQLLLDNIEALRNDPIELKQRIERFKTPLRADVLAKFVG